MSTLMHARVDDNIAKLSPLRESIAAGVTLPVPQTPVDITDGLNAFNFRLVDGSYERPGIADRLRELGELATLSPIQKQEGVALQLIRTSHSLVTLFSNGELLGARIGPIDLRTDALSQQGFAVHAPDVQLRKAVTGLARRRAEQDPSINGWRTVSVAALDTQLALYRAKSSAEKAILSESTLVKLGRGLAPHLRLLTGIESS